MIVVVGWQLTMIININALWIISKQSRPTHTSSSVKLVFSLSFCFSLVQRWWWRHGGDDDDGQNKYTFCGLSKIAAIINIPMRQYIHKHRAVCDSHFHSRPLAGIRSSLSIKAGTNICQLTSTCIHTLITCDDVCQLALLSTPTHNSFSSSSSNNEHD